MASTQGLETGLLRAARAGLINAQSLEQLISSMGGAARPSAAGTYVNTRV